LMQEQRKVGPQPCRPVHRPLAWRQDLPAWTAH
jgi:hypothetical protein